jgi:hypothetical protein
MLAVSPSEHETPVESATTAKPRVAHVATSHPATAVAAAADGDLGTAPPVPPGSRADALGATLARAVQGRVPIGGHPLLQRLSPTTADPTTKADGTHYDRSQMVNVLGEIVPRQITALMRNPGFGGVPSVAPPGWGWLGAHVKKLKGAWVRFHIINRLLGGPGKYAWNLVPTSVAINNAFNRDIEEDVKDSASTQGDWTYLDVGLTYDAAWPAPIPRRIDAEWGNWSTMLGAWQQQGTKSMLNFDITSLLGGPIYLRGDNITRNELIKHGVPASRAGAFATWLKQYERADDSEEDYMAFGEDADNAGYDENWVASVFLDDDETEPGAYKPVVQKIE